MGWTTVERATTRFKALRASAKSGFISSAKRKQDDASSKSPLLSSKMPKAYRIYGFFPSNSTACRQ